MKFLSQTKFNNVLICRYLSRYISLLIRKYTSNNNVLNVFKTFYKIIKTHKIDMDKNS